jgi:hypothetical protein
VFFRSTAVVALSLSVLFAQSDTPAAGSSPDAAASPLRVDEADPMVVRARDNLEQVRKLVTAGALPLMRLQRAQEEVQDAMDMSLLKKSLYSSDILPEQAQQMILVAQRMVLRRERALSEMQQMADAGIVSLSEAQASNADLLRARQDLDWARTRAKLVEQLAESMRLEKAIASLETQAESHPEWAGRVYTHYDGNGTFTTAALRKMEIAYITKFAKPLPVSAEGETALHRSFGFDHRGRVDVALNPDQPEGTWLMRYLESKRIPYFAFRAAVAHMATGAHIHVGPQSTKLALSD